MNAHPGLLVGTVQRAWTADDAAQIRALWARRVKKSDMALMMGRSEGSIAAYVKKHRKDFPPRPHGRIPQRPEAAPARISQPRKPGLVDVRPDAVQAANPVRLIHLSNLTCRWPVEGHGQGTWFCGAEPEGRSSYCACHRARATRVAR